MKRNGLRALGLATCAVVLVSMIGLAVNVASIIQNELIEEISKAAGLALVGQYVIDYEDNVEELEELAATGRTPGIQLAADKALFIINGREMELYEMDMAELLALAEGGDQDAADMWFFRNRSSFTRPEKLEAYIADGTYSEDGTAIIEVTSDALETAAGKLLGGFYLPGSPLGAKTEDELDELAMNGESLGLRVAAATALTAIWINGQPLTIDQTRTEILSVTLVYPELALAYQGYLAYLFGQEL